MCTTVECAVQEAAEDVDAKAGELDIRSVYVHAELEALRHKWIESERAQRDLGEEALRHWAKTHWPKYLRACLVEHIQGVRFWKELDRGDFGILRRKFHDCPVLLDRILDRIKEGQENLDIIQWALDWNMPSEPVHDILKELNINARRLACYFGEINGDCPADRC